MRQQPIHVLSPRRRRAVAAAAVAALVAVLLGVPPIPRAWAAEDPWTGALTLTADPATVTAGAPGTTLVARMDPGLTSHYALTLYDDGQRVGACASGIYGGLAECRWNRWLDANSTHVYTAFVAHDSPDTGPRATTCAPPRRWSWSTPAGTAPCR